MKRICGIVMMGGLLAAAGCHSLNPPKARSGTVHHVLLCWLKQPGDAGARDHIIRASRSFRDFPGLLSVGPGTALPSRRPVVDSSFDVGIVFTFRDEQAMTDYFRNPVHQKAQKEVLEPLVSRILVYDIVEK